MAKPQHLLSHKEAICKKEDLPIFKNFNEC